MFLIDNLSSSVQNSNGSIGHRGPLIQATFSSSRGSSNNREDILRNLLRVELQEAAHHYLSRTQRSTWIQYVFLVSYIERDE